MILSESKTHEFLETLPFAKNYYFFPVLMMIYLCVVLKIGPSYMKNKPPKRWIKKIIPLFNIAQIFMNAAIVVIAFRDIDFIKFSVNNLCGNNIPTQEFRNKFILLGYLWCWIKVTDFLDTIFFILTRKESHVTFLHVYHHSNTMMIAFVVYRFLYTEQSLVYAAVNCMIHCFMYTYYLLTSLGYKPKWKYIVTTCQLAQFLGLLVLTIYLLTCQCNPKYFYFSCYGFYQCVMYLYLFGKFYVNAYKKNN